MMSGKAPPVCESTKAQNGKPKEGRQGPLAACLSGAVRWTVSLWAEKDKDARSDAGSCCPDRKAVLNSRQQVKVM